MKKNILNLVKAPKLKINFKKKEETSSCIVRKESDQETDHDYAMNAATINKRERGADMAPTTPT